MKVINWERWHRTTAIIGMLMIIAAAIVSTNNFNNGIDTRLDPFTVLLTFGLYLNLRALKQHTR